MLVFSEVTVRFLLMNSSELSAFCSTLPLANSFVLPVALPLRAPVPLVPNNPSPRIFGLLGTVMGLLLCCESRGPADREASACC